MNDLVKELAHQKLIGQIVEAIEMATYLSDNENDKHAKCVIELIKALGELGAPSPSHRVDPTHY
jgi:hypothetical protein